MIKMVEKWWKAWSVWLLIAANAIAGLQMFIPDIQQALPDHWYRYAFGAILIARMIKQNLPKADEPQA